VFGVGEAGLTLSRRDLHAMMLGVAFAAGSSPSLAAGPDAGQGDSEGLLAHIDPELRDGARVLLAQGSMDWTRQELVALRGRIPPPPKSLASPSVERRVVPGGPGGPDVAVQVIGASAGGKARPALLHIHGGGFILGRPEDSTPLCQTIAAELDCLVVNVDYRLSPETPFPGPVEDCYAALAWLHRNADALGVDRSRIAVMGESAGGGLAAMVAIAARDRREIQLRYQVLIYPMLDDRTGSTRRVPPFIGRIGWNESGNRFGWTSFLGAPAGQGKPPRGAVPARVADLRGLAPAFIGVGGVDLFVEEDLEYARRLVLAGVPTQFQLTPGAYHGFDFIAPQSRPSRAFTAAWMSGLRAALA